MNFKVNRKKRVFISSKCGGRYDFIRRELEIFLKMTGLFEVYNFDGEGSSASDVKTQYLEGLASCDIAVFLIDNKDGVSDAVYGEYRLTREKGLKCHYLFCDEDSKKVTGLQDEVSSFAKYRVEHEFVKMPETAFTSILQDLIDSYCRKISDVPIVQSSTSVKDKNIIDVSDLRSGQFLRKDLCVAPKEIRQHIWYLVSGDQSEPLDDDEEKTQISEAVNDAACSFIDAICCLKDFDSRSYELLSQYIISSQSSELPEILNHRLQAIQSFYSGNIDQAVAEERAALHTGIQKIIPSWLLNDIAIDLRNLIIESNIKKRYDSEYLIIKDNEGKNYLDKTSEYIHFPVYDRMISNGNQRILRKYQNEEMKSPYTVTYASNPSILVADYADAFWITLMYGSLVHIRLFISHMSDVLKVMIHQYDDHFLTVQLIRFVYADNENIKDSLDFIERTYSSNIDILSPDEAQSVFSSIQRIPIVHTREKEEYEFFARFSMYLDDKVYENLCTYLIQKSYKWLQAPYHDAFMMKQIAEFFVSISPRNHLDDSVLFAIEFLKGNNSEPERMDLCNAYRGIDYSRVNGNTTSEFAELLLSILIAAKSPQDPKANLVSYVKSLLRTISIENDFAGQKIGLELKGKYPELYIEIYKLEHDFKLNREGNNINVFPYIKEQLNRINADNKIISSELISYGEDPYEITYNMICKGKVALDEEKIEEVFQCMHEVLFNDSQTIAHKVTACEIITSVSLRNQSSKNEVVCKDYRDHYEDCMICKNWYDSNDLPIELKYAYRLMLQALHYKKDELIKDALFSSPQDNTYVLIRMLSITLSYLKSDYNLSIRNTFLNSFLSFSLVTMQNKERDVRAYSALVLIELSRYKKIEDAALRNLSLFMNSGNVQMRRLIVRRVKTLSSRNKYVKDIMQKARLDHNYLVRQAAEI